MPGDNQILKTKISTSTHGGLSVCAGVYLQILAEKGWRPIEKKVVHEQSCNFRHGILPTQKSCN